MTIAYFRRLRMYQGRLRPCPILHHFQCRKVLHPLHRRFHPDQMQRQAHQPVLLVLNQLELKEYMICRNLQIQT